MEIVWDEPKRLRNLETHHLDFADIHGRFAFNEAVTVLAHPGNDGRRRFKAIGFLDTQLIAVVFSPLGTEGISLISMRHASRSERRLYEQS
jgi:uncharacterized DUF497 family protein